jgi:bifunctional NMN adenylyltransferase/nudix hydrolase
VRKGAFIAPFSFSQMVSGTCLVIAAGQVIEYSRGAFPQGAKGNLMTQSYDVAVVIGRFQPFHNGHLALVREALRVAPRVIVVIGSAFAARSPRNPWTYEERAMMLSEALSAEEVARVQWIPMRDYFYEPRWRKVLVDKVTELTGGARIGVVGHFKDTTSDYLDGFDRWGLVRVPLLGDVHATELRHAYFADANVVGEPHFAQATSEFTRRWLADFARRPEYLQLREESAALEAYKRAWQSAPFPPTFVTVDAVVTCRGHVLLIRRGKSPGKGSWAVPGGFLDPSETVLQGALRELTEETGLTLVGEACTPKAAHVFDHPQRSQRGRTISHGFHFELQAAQLPRVQAADDAAAAEWILCSELTARESEFFDDHFHTFLGLLPEGRTRDVPRK